MLTTVSLVAVALAGFYLVALSAVSFLAPSRASTFLMGFASSPRAHSAELAVRLVVGCAFVLRAPMTLYPAFFAAFGWLLVGTTAVLVLVPWRWHRAFAQRSVPQALRYLPLVAVASLLLGAFVLWAALSPAV